MLLFSVQTKDVSLILKKNPHLFDLKRWEMDDANRRRCRLFIYTNYQHGLHGLFLLCWAADYIIICFFLSTWSLLPPHSYWRPNLNNDHLVSSFCFIQDFEHAHWPSPFPLSSTPECSLMIIHELYDKMSTAHLISSSADPDTTASVHCRLVFMKMQHSHGFLSGFSCLFRQKCTGW